MCQPQLREASRNVAFGFCRCQLHMRVIRSVPLDAVFVMSGHDIRIGDAIWLHPLKLQIFRESELSSS